MNSAHFRSYRTRTAVAAVALTATLGLAACGEDSPEEDLAVPGEAEDVLEEDQVLEDEGILDEDAVEPGAGIQFEEIPGDELVDPAFEDLYDDAFLSEIDSYVEQQVVLTGEVLEVLDPAVFAMTALDDPTVQPILVVSPDPVPALEPGVPVRVGGTLEDSFELGTVEEDLGSNLDDQAFESYPGAPFVLADVVQVSSSAGASPTPTG